MSDRAQREVGANRKPGDSAFVAELFKSADPAVAGFMARHSALLERVTVLERALEHVREFGEKLMSSEDENERLIGCCVCEATRPLDA